jgi:predicted GIY-YIG superfamily endonuclease
LSRLSIKESGVALRFATAVQRCFGSTGDSEAAYCLKLKRRTLKKFQTREESAHHHCVYVVLLSREVCKSRKVREANPNRATEKPCVYVGLTGHSPEKRFANHKKGIKAASFVRRFGLKLLPELYEHLNPMPYDAAAQMEKDLAEDLRAAGYTVLGGV